MTRRWNWTTCFMNRLKFHVLSFVTSLTTSSVGLDMFIFTDAIFVSMSKSHRRNDIVDQQERVRRLWPYLPRESVHHHRFGHLTLWRAYIIAMLYVHHYIVSPVTLFRVLWRTHFKNRRISSHGSLSHHLNPFTNYSSVCLRLHGSWRHLCCFFRLQNKKYHSVTFIVQKKNHLVVNHLVEGW